MKAIVALAAALVLASFSFAACGDDDGYGSDDSAATSSAPAAGTETATDSSAAPNRVDITAPANGDLVFNPAQATARAGALTLVLDNEADTAHNLCLEDAQGKPVYECGAPTVGGALTVPIDDIKPGTYTYFCDVDGHREAGMEGTLTVK